MYAGTTFHSKSGRIVGVHQKIDRVARRHIASHIPKSSFFPRINEILHFEGVNGPDGIKRKSPGKDEPWHFINPDEHANARLLVYIHDHIHNLTEALVANNRERAAFEAAWLAHAIVDGLTPAHHYPFEEEVTKLRGKSPLESATKREKFILPGSTNKEFLKNNWAYWGAKGVWTSHIGFEWGVASAVSTMKFDSFSFHDLARQYHDHGFDTMYKRSLADISGMGMYDEFLRSGWTRHLAKETKDVLVPEIINMVMLGWYGAMQEAV